MNLDSLKKGPKWAIAYKFKPEEKETIIEDIIYQVGRTGAITPVAVLKPVLISGSIVTRATLHNEDEIARLGLYKNDTVKIIKSGEIIPKVLEVISSKRVAGTVPFRFIEYCPVCKTKLHKDNDASITYCDNSSCPAQLQRKLEHFTSREAMDIEGLGPALIKQLVDEDIIHAIPDIYKLDYARVMQLDRIGEKSVNNLRRSIDNSVKQPFERVLFALGIRYIGNRTSKILVQHFKDIHVLRKVALDELLQVNEIGSKIAGSILDFFQEENNNRIIDELQEIGLQFTYESKSIDSRFEGKKFLITGSLSSMTRVQAENAIEARNGMIASSVNKTLNYLIVGENPGSKVDKAKGINSIQIINEKDFMNLLE